MASEPSTLNPQLSTAHATRARPTIAVLGTFDTKGAEHAFLAEAIRRAGVAALLIDVGSQNAPSITPDVTSDIIAAAGGDNWREVRARQDRGECVAFMGQAAARYVSNLAAQEKIHGII